MCLLDFHTALLGLDPEATPPEYQLSETQKLLYGAYEQLGCRGLSSMTPEKEIVLGTFVLALYQTILPGDEKPAPVMFFVAKPIEADAMKVIKGVVSYIFASRVGLAVDDSVVVYKAIQSLSFGSRVLQIQKAPDRWTALGFDTTGLAPNWLKESLCVQ